MRVNEECYKEGIIKLIEIQVKQNRALDLLDQAGMNSESLVPNDLAESIYHFLGYKVVKDSYIECFNEMMKFYTDKKQLSVKESAVVIYKELMIIKRGHERGMDSIEKMFSRLLSELSIKKAANK